MPGTPATTPIHGAPRIANTDTFDLARDLNSVADAFDATAVAYSSGLASARPATGVNNRWYYATDTRQWSRYTTGGGWETPVPSTHAATHQDGGTDALTVREAMMAVGALGLAKGAFSAYRNAAATLPTTLSDLVFDTEEFDVSNWYDPATGVYTPQVAGVYRFSWSVWTNATGTADSQLVAHLYKNGTRIKAGLDGVQRGTNQIASGHSVLAKANGTTDAFKVQAAITVTSVAMRTGLDFTYFQAEFVGRT